MVHSTEFKVGMHIITYPRTNPIDFRECRMCIFFYRGTKSNSYTLWPIESNYCKCARVETVPSTDLKFGMRIIGRHPICCINFAEFRLIIFFTGVKKRKKNTCTLYPMESNYKLYVSV